MKQNNTARRNFLKGAALGTASLVMNQKKLKAGSSREKKSLNSESVPLSSGKPNILIIMTDQHRADLMTCAGRDLVPTPAIDRIASRGIRFTNVYCPYPACVASRMSLLTGLYPHSTGAITNQDRLDWRYRTIAHTLGENGYLTGLIGKMHFNDAHKHGFEYYLSINDWLMYLGPKVQHYANEIANHPIAPVFFKTVTDDGAGFPDISGLGKSQWIGKVKRYNFDSMASQLEPEDHLDMFVARESAKFIRQHRDQNFFLVSSFMKPHSPFYPPKKWAEKYPVNKIKLPPVGDISQYPERIRNRIKRTQGLDEKRLRAHRSGYLGNLAFVDTCIEYLYKALETEGLLENTIVVYTSDHGEMDGDHGLYQKFCLFEPSVKVPLIVSYPKQLPQNRVSDILIEYFGLNPTLLELCGIDPPASTTLQDIPGAPEKMDAKSFAGYLHKPNKTGPSAVFSENNLRISNPEYMIRTKKYKYVFNHGPMKELYDLETDPGEKKNLIRNRNLQKVTRNLRDQLFAWYNPEKNPFRKIRKKKKKK